MGETIAFGVFVGVAATVTMDMLAVASRKAGWTVGARGDWVGRWYLGVFRGQFVHRDIALSPEQPGERRAALVGHYLIGVVLAVFYVVGARWLGISPEGLLAAVGYGLATCVFPWLLVFPCLGFGLLGLKGPPELELLRASVANHLVYGLGLWWSAGALSLIWS